MKRSPISMLIPRLLSLPEALPEALPKALAMTFVLCLGGGGLFGLGGCVSAPSRSGGHELDSSSGHVQIEGVSFEAVFDISRDVLSEYRFGINRVDASRGVLTTFPKRTQGLISFWDREQSTLGQEWEDFTNQQERVIRVSFEEHALDEGIADEIGSSRIDVVVEALVYRIHRPHWRVDAQSIRLSSHAASRDESGKVESREFREPIGQDALLAQRIADAIAHRFN